MSISGQTSRTIVKMAGSAIISASGFTSFNSLTYSSAGSKSSLCAKILTVTYTFTPASCANSTPSFISSIVKFFALARSPKTSPPIYTASAPYLTALFKTSRLLAGTINSGFFITTSNLICDYFFTAITIPSPIGTILVSNLSSCFTVSKNSRIRL